MMQMTHSLLPALALAALLVGCKGAGTPDDASYRLTKYGVKAWYFGEEVSTSGANLLPACRQDDRHVFHQDGSFQYAVDKLTCSAEDVDRKGTWRFSAGKDSLLVYLNGDTTAYRIEQLSEHNLNLRRDSLLLRLNCGCK